MKTKGLVLTISISTALLVAGLLMWRKPVLFSFAPSANASGKPFICVLNPFRDRNPEVFIGALLEKLQSQSPIVFSEYFPNEKDPDFQVFMTKTLKENPLESWKLKCIVQNKSGDFTYCYSAVRQGRSEAIEIWISLKREVTGFRVTNFEYGVR